MTERKEKATKEEIRPFEKENLYGIMAHAIGVKLCTTLLTAILINLFIAWAWGGTEALSFSPRHVMGIWGLLLYRYVSGFIVLLQKMHDK